MLFEPLAFQLTKLRLALYVNAWVHVQIEERKWLRMSERGMKFQWEVFLPMVSWICPIKQCRCSEQYVDVQSGWHHAKICLEFDIICPDSSQSQPSHLLCRRPPVWTCRDTSCVSKEKLGWIIVQICWMSSSWKIVETRTTNRRRPMRTQRIVLTNIN
jgi:hypothetical protein